MSAQIAFRALAHGRKRLLVPSLPLVGAHAPSERPGRRTAVGQCSQFWVTRAVRRWHCRTAHGQSPAQFASNRVDSGVLWGSSGERLWGSSGEKLINVAFSLGGCDCSSVATSCRRLLQWVMVGQAASTSASSAWPGCTEPTLLGSATVRKFPRGCRIHGQRLTQTRRSGLAVPHTIFRPHDLLRQQLSTSQGRDASPSLWITTLASPGHSSTSP